MRRSAGKTIFLVPAEHAEKGLSRGGHLIGRPDIQHLDHEHLLTAQPGNCPIASSMPLVRPIDSPLRVRLQC